MATQRKHVSRRESRAQTSTFSVRGRVAAIKNRVAQLKIKERSRRVYKIVVKKIEARPIISLLTVLGVLLLFIIIGSFLRRPTPEEAPQRAVKEVRLYSIGSAPRVTVQAQVEKSGVIKIVALSGGVVSDIFVTEGQFVEKGTTLVSLGSNYSGGNTATLSRQLAASTYQNTKDTFETQKDILAKQKEVAAQTDSNADQMREISQQSVLNTESLINLNNEVTRSIQATLDTLQANNAGGANDQAILGAKQQLSQFRGAIIQLESSLGNARLQAGDENPTAKLSDLQREITLKQLDVQERALKLSLETSSLQLKIAQVNEAAFFPTTPFAATIERVHVTLGQSVQPGTTLVTLHGDQTAKLIARVSGEIAKNASPLELSTLLVNGKSLQASPLHITTDATDGSLYAIIYELPAEYQNTVTQASYIPIEIPIGAADTSASIPFVPLDAVHQSQNKSYLFIHQNGEAHAKEINLGGIFGQYIEITKGLNTGDQIILDRTVIEGDRVEVKN